MAVDAPDVLLGLAETAVGIAGFAGVAAAVMLSRSIERDDQFRFLCLFASALSVVFLAFTPVLLELAGIRGERLWAWSSSAFIAVALVALPLAVFTARLAARRQKMAPAWALGILWIFTLAGAARCPFAATPGAPPRRAGRPGPPPAQGVSATGCGGSSSQ